MKPIKSFLLLLASVTLALSSCGPLKRMQPNVPNGGRAVSIARHPSNNNNFFVASESGGIFKSTNAGVTWTQVTTNSTFWYNDVKFCTLDPTIIIAAASSDTKVSNGGGIWRSTDSGNSWTHISLTPPVSGCAATLSAFSVAVEPGNNKIWVGTSCGLAVSTDNGATFNFIASSTNYNNDVVYAVLAPQQNEIKILTDAGVKVSSNDGASWSFSTGGLPYVLKGNHAQIACSPLNHQHIFWASNFAPGDGQWHNGVYYSTDNGNTWTNLIDNVGINRPPTCFTAANLGGDASKFDVYFSDGGCTFQRASFTNRATMSGGWTSLNVQHCDHADLSFKTDGKTPVLLAGDGGLFTTADNGGNWSYTGGGSNGYNALQITEVTGQLHSGDSKSDLYYGTQDNDIRASSDGGATWPDANKTCCEGFFLNIPRQSLPSAETKFTGVNCGACYNFMSAPLLSGGAPGFPNVADATGNPRLLKPGAYIQSSTLPGVTTLSIFNLTTNNGATWNAKYAITNEQRDLSKIAGDGADPVVFTAVRYPGATADGQEIVGIKKIVGTLGSGSPIVSDVTGFGSLGIFPTMFAWYKPFGVDPFDPNHIILSDITTEKIRVTRDGGASWTDDNNLTNLVTQTSTFKFRWGPFTQVSSVGFDPDVRGRILVGTVQAGIYCTCDGGNSWSKVEGTEIVPSVSSFYFVGNNKIIVSSYGRGLWKLNLAKCPLITIRPIDFQVAEPVIRWKGAYVPIRQINNPDVCPVCGYFLIERGDITAVTISKESNEVTDIAISGGDIKGFTYDEQAILSIPFRISKSEKSFNAELDEDLRGMFSNGYKVKGLLIENKMYKGLILAKEDIRTNQLPKKQEPKVVLKADVIRDERTGNVSSIRIRGKGFDKSAPITIKVDGKSIDIINNKATFDQNDTMEISLSPLFTPGGHTLLIEQKSEKGAIREAITFIIPHNDRNEQERK
jgi:hypothetical protein